MANTITKFKKYVTLLDEVYKNAALTSVLDSDASLASAGANANEIVIPKISMDGLGDYDRNSGYTNGSVTLTNETVQFNYERGRMFTVDAMDNEETAGLAYGKLASEFIRTQVAPEGDAFRFATYASVSGISKVAAGATLSTGADVIEKLVILRAWGGNFLANMGPMADGSIPKEAFEAWKDMGTWMKHSGESIYHVKGGNFPEKDNQPTTVKKDTTYVHVYPNFHKKVIVGDVKNAPKSATLLRTGEPIAVSFKDGRVEFQIPPSKRSREVDTVRLTW